MIGTQVFLSYALEDLPLVRRVYEGLVARGLSVWYDREHLGTGQWKTRIRSEILRSRYFLVCMSQAALRKHANRAGFQDEELQLAYEIASAVTENDFTIVPVRLEECGRGDLRLIPFNQFDLFPDFEEGLDKVALLLGGRSLRDSNAKDRRTDAQREIDKLTAPLCQYG